MKRDLHIDNMRHAAKKMEGTHDFRNFAKLDIGNVSNFVREIETADILPYEGDEGCQFSTFMLEIKGNAFLWHQIRCIMAVLFLIGEGKEEVSIVDQLLDVEREPAKPDYAMASDAPLVLNECYFNNLQFSYQPRVLWDLSVHFNAILNQQLIAVARTKNALKSLENMMVRDSDAKDLKLSLFDNNVDKLKSKNKKMKTVSSSYLSPLSSSSHASKLIRWHDLLHELQTEGINPYNSVHSSINGSRYIRLLNRSRNDTYEKRCSQLTGTKKERLKRHLQLKEENKDTDFFSVMRSEGSVAFK